jgi:hypothetical protein
MLTVVDNCKLWQSARCIIPSARCSAAAPAPIVAHAHAHAHARCAHAHAHAHVRQLNGTDSSAASPFRRGGGLTRQAQQEVSACECARTCVCAYTGCDFVFYPGPLFLCAVSTYRYAAIISLQSLSWTHRLSVFWALFADAPLVEQCCWLSP